MFFLELGYKVVTLKRGQRSLKKLDLRALLLSRQLNRDLVVKFSGYVESVNHYRPYIPRLELFHKLAVIDRISYLLIRSKEPAPQEYEDNKKQQN